MPPLTRADKHEAAATVFMSGLIVLRAECRATDLIADAFIHNGWQSSANSGLLGLREVDWELQFSIASLGDTVFSRDSLRRFDSPGGTTSPAHSAGIGSRCRSPPQP